MSKNTTIQGGYRSMIKFMSECEYENKCTNCYNDPPMNELHIYTFTGGAPELLATFGQMGKGCH